MPTKFYNKPILKKIRSKLRNEMTRGEKILWSKLRRKNLEFKFRRQYGIGNYVLDFYCVELKLAIEIDGLSHHSEKAFEEDCKRQKYLESLGITVMRYNSEDVFKKLEQVAEQIYQTCQNLNAKLPTPTSPPPYKGGESRRFLSP
ncbi:endonuclease domain-containing protein [Patescibacteria group bacterium]|nr:MAG: endonuclease domain-containing protein [Patescibacteria group bacterium]